MVLDRPGNGALGEPCISTAKPYKDGGGGVSKIESSSRRHEALTESPFGEKEEREEEGEREGDQPTFRPSGSYVFQLGHAHKQIGIS